MVILAQSSLSSISGYVLQTMVILVYICDDTNKIGRNFIWENTSEQQKHHKVFWKKLNSLKEKITWVYETFVSLTKLTCTNLLLVQIARAKYKCGNYPIPKLKFYQFFHYLEIHMYGMVKCCS